jgi:hypothetical protein
MLDFGNQSGALMSAERRPKRAHWWRFGGPTDDLLERDFGALTLNFNAFVIDDAR